MVNCQKCNEQSCSSLRKMIAQRGYDLKDLGFDVKGVASLKSYQITHRGWKIIDIPSDIPEGWVRQRIDFLLGEMCAVEIPTSLVCNLRCRYCYITDPHMKNINVPSTFVERVAQKFYTDIFLTFSKRKREICFSAWGAEPICNMDTLYALLDVMKNIKSKDEGLKVKFNTSTNATISNEKVMNFFREIFSLKFSNSIQVSLDGNRELQDRNRPFASGKGSFDNVKKFCETLNEMAKDIKNGGRFYSFCSTIHIQDDTFVDDWYNAQVFFSEPNQWHSALPFSPSRMSSNDMSSEELVKKFVEAQRKGFEVSLERAKQGINFISFYTNKLFLSYDNKSPNAYPYCSAMNTQLGIDLDGGIYLCHGPITSPWQKPWGWIGNLFEKVISFLGIERVVSAQYGSIWNKAKCEGCPINVFGGGIICWSCQPHNLEATGEPTQDFLLKCVAFNEAFKYWVYEAYMNIESKLINRLINFMKNNPNHFLTKEINLNYLLSLPRLERRLLPIKEVEKTFNPEANFSVSISAMKLSPFGDRRKVYHLVTKWWDYDNFLDAVKEERKKWKTK